MKLTLVSSSISRNAGGMFEAMRQLSFALRNLPATEISVLAGRDDQSDNDLPAWGDLRVKVNNVHGPSAFGWQPGLMAALDEERPDLLYQHGLWMYSSLATLRWSEKTRRPRLVAAHGMLDPWALSVSGWKKRLALVAYEGRSLKGATVLHALNRAEHDAMRAFGLKNPIAILPNGIELGISTDTHEPPPWVADLPSDASILLFLGRLHPKKGLPSLLEALALAPSPSLRSWRLVIVGWDQNGHRAELERQAVALGIAEQIHFAGPLHGRAKYAALAAADAFILPSHSEGLPMSVLEAWAFSLPVLMTDACNLPEGFAQGAAMRIDSDPALLAGQLALLADMTGAERTGMGQRGRRLVVERFSWDTIALRLRAVSTWMLGGGAPPPEIEMGQNAD